MFNQLYWFLNFIQPVPSSDIYNSLFFVYFCHFSLNLSIVLSTTWSWISFLFLFTKFPWKWISPIGVWSITATESGLRALESQSTLPTQHTLLSLSLSLSCHFHVIFTFIPLALSVSIHLSFNFFLNYASSNNNLDCGHLNPNQHCRRSILCFHFHFTFNFTFNFTFIISLSNFTLISPLLKFYLHIHFTFIFTSFLLLSGGNTLDHLGSLGLSLASHTRVTSRKSCKTLG